MAVTVLVLMLFSRTVAQCFSRLGYVERGRCSTVGVPVPHSLWPDSLQLLFAESLFFFNAL